MLHPHLLRKKFSQAFATNADEARIFFSPGRVCLIGEHVDYNGGMVLPAALSLGIYGVFRQTDSHVLRMKSCQQKNEVTLRLDEEISFSEKTGWGNYPAGVLKYLKQKGFQPRGGELLFDSNLPMGAGLSSSAAIEMLTALIFSSNNDNKRLGKLELARLCKTAENEFVGVRCGIMDQCAIAMGEKNHALLLDCSTLKHELVPAALGDNCIIIFNTGIKRELTKGFFNQRVSECEEALKSIRKHKPLKHLADADEQDVKELVANPIAKKRALHVVQENQRVKLAAEALKTGDINQFGLLLFQSHASLKRQYEVTGAELDTIEEAAQNHPACIGAKMSGAGFGGCAFALVKKDAAEDFVRYVLNFYFEKTHCEASYCYAEIDDGVRRIA
ncbi:MAG TPA: galactokinase [Chitinophagales bacterium]|nr:galactokinase [Chitinophagales bacterium]